jgi:hypothetical protein
MVGLAACAQAWTLFQGAERLRRKLLHIGDAVWLLLPYESEVRLGRWQFVNGSAAELRRQGAWWFDTNDGVSGTERHEIEQGRRGHLECRSG